MLRVGLTGGLGSGKSTVAALLRERGFTVLEADAIAREMMEPGQPIYRAIVEHFGPGVRRADGSLDRARIAELVFNQGRLPELNQIVHPPVVAEQERRMGQMFARDPHAIIFVESALIFEAGAWGTVPEWRRRFDRIVLVAAPDDRKVERFLARILPPDTSAEQRARVERDARARLAAQLPDSVKIPQADVVLDNAGSLNALLAQVDQLAAALRAEARVNADAQAPDPAARP